MKKLALSAFLGASLFSISAFAGEWAGTISDSGCAAKHADASEKSQACVKSCIQNRGMAAVFVTDGKVLKFSDSSKDKIADHLGHKVTISGKLDGDTITVDSVKM